MESAPPQARPRYAGRAELRRAAIRVGRASESCIRVTHPISVLGPRLRQGPSAVREGCCKPVAARQGQGAHHAVLRTSESAMGPSRPQAAVRVPSRPTRRIRAGPGYPGPRPARPGTHRTQTGDQGGRSRPGSGNGSGPPGCGPSRPRVASRSRPSGGRGSGAAAAASAPLLPRFPHPAPTAQAAVVSAPVLGLLASAGPGRNRPVAVRPLRSPTVAGGVEDSALTCCCLVCTGCTGAMRVGQQLES